MKNGHSRCQGNADGNGFDILILEISADEDKAE